MTSFKSFNNARYKAQPSRRGSQRSAIWYGNDTKTGYTYDDQTFRLRRLLTINLTTNDAFQDLNYYYDPVGNITRIDDDAQQELFFDNSVVSPSQVFTYDALYRLIQAEGRELIGTATYGAEDNWNDSAWMSSYITDGSAVQNYTQVYTYDAVGNILELQHIAGSGSYTREYYYDDINNNNQLVQTNVNGDNYYYTDYDNRGNMQNMPNMSVMEWNLSNELNHVVTGSLDAWYQYSSGQRIRKYLDKGSEAEERIYLGNFEIYRKFDSLGELVVERTTVHITDDTGRIAMIEHRTYGSSGDDNHTAETLKRFIYSNHLQSASLELDDRGDIISYEEYHPYGTTSFQEMNAGVHACAKRYRYTGKERDEESGLYYHGARYYVPWLGRWCAVDPLESKYAGMSPYNYCDNNPVMFIDPTGTETGDPGDPGDPQNVGDGKRGQGNGKEKKSDSNVTGGWYIDKKGNKQFAEGIHTKEEFENSAYKDKGEWWATGGAESGFGEYSKDPYVQNYREDGSILQSYQSGKHVIIPYKGNATLKKEGKKNFDARKEVKKTELTKEKGVPSKTEKTYLKPKLVKSSFADSDITGQDLINTSISAAGTGLNMLQGLLTKEKNAAIEKAAANRFNRFLQKQTAKQVASFSESIGKIDKFSKKLGWIGIGVSALFLTSKYYNEGITLKDAFDTGVSLGLMFLSISNPIGLGILGGYGLLDAMGVFDKPKDFLIGKFKSWIGKNDDVIFKH